MSVPRGLADTPFGGRPPFLRQPPPPVDRQTVLKILPSHAVGKKFVYRRHPFTTRTFFCIFLCDASGIQCNFFALLLASEFRLIITNTPYANANLFHFQCVDEYLHFLCDSHIQLKVKHFMIKFCLLYSATGWKIFWIFTIIYWKTYLFSEIENGCKVVKWSSICSMFPKI